DHGLARVPRLAAAPGLPVPRGYDPGVLAHQFDPGRFAKAVAAHEAGEAVDPHLVGEVVVVIVDRARDRVAQVDPAAAAAGVAVAAPLARDEELAGGEHP